MTSPQARKGAEAEREVAALLASHLGYPVKRRKNLGTHEDIGDIIGLPDTCVQVAWWANIASAVRIKPVECERQQQEMGATHGVTAIRLRGGDYRWVLTTDQMMTLLREALS